MLAGVRFGVENALRERAVPTQKEDDHKHNPETASRGLGDLRFGLGSVSRNPRPRPPRLPPRRGTRTYSEYEAAAKACGAKTGLARSDCVRDARDAYDKAMETANPTIGGGHGSPNGSGGTSGSSGPKNVRS